MEDVDVVRSVGLRRLRERFVSERYLSHSFFLKHTHHHSITTRYTERVNKMTSKDVNNVKNLRWTLLAVRHNVQSSSFYRSHTNHSHKTDHRISHRILCILYRNSGEKVNQVEIRAHDRDVRRGTHRGWILLFRGSRGDLHRDCHGGCEFRSTDSYGKWTSSAQSLFERCEHSSFSSTRYVGS